MTVKLLGEETSLNSTELKSVDNATVVRVINTATSTQKVVIKSSNTVVASVTLAAGEALSLQKSSSDTLSTPDSDDEVLAVKVAHSN